MGAGLGSYLVEAHYLGVLEKGKQRYLYNHPAKYFLQEKAAL